MADRSIIVAVESASTGGVLGLRLTVAADRRSVAIRRDTTYNRGNPSDLIGLGVGVVSVTQANPPQVGTIVNLGGDWNDLDGDGQTFSWTTNEQIDVHIYAIPLGHTRNRGTSVPADATQKPLITSGLGLAATLEIGEDGYFRPDFSQDNNYYASLRDIPGPDVVFHYTTREKVETRLLTPTNLEAGFDTDFRDVLTDCIRAAEDMLDEYLGRTFRQFTTQRTAVIEIRSQAVIATPDIRGDRTPTVSVGGSALPQSNYRFSRPFDEYDVMKNLRPRNGWVPPLGQDLTLTYTPGWPVVPAPIQEAATRAAAELFRSGELKHGVYESATGMPMPARRPMASIFERLRPFRAVSV